MDFVAFEFAVHDMPAADVMAVFTSHAGQAVGILCMGGG